MIDDLTEVSPGTPEWIEPSFVFKAGADPLGIQTITQDRVIGRLLPGILALSERARYFSFYSFLVRRYEELRRTPTNRALLNYVRARDYEYALAVRMCPNHCGSSPVGATNAGRALSSRPPAYVRGESVESNGGGYGLYYGSPMRMLGLIAPTGTLLGDVPITVDVVRRPGRGLALADAFWTAIADTRYVTEGYLDNEEPIPEDVLIEYASKACLCRLQDFPEERDILRDVLLAPDASLDPGEVRPRREGIALFLERLAEDQHIGESDEVFRRAIWTAFVEAPRIKDSRRSRTLARWAAVAASHWAQMALMIIWTSAGPALRNHDRGGGLTHEKLAELIADLVAGEVTVGGTAVAIRGDVLTRELDAELRSHLSVSALPDLARDLRKAGSPVAGLCQLLLVRAALPARDDVEPDWIEFGRIDGEWQPGLLRMIALLDAHLADNPTVAESVAWLLNHFVLRAHERIAYSKLPEFTFRFRWEVGRLRFYAHPFGWTDPGHIRASTLTSLTRDVGFWEMVDDKRTLTPDGVALVRQVLE